MREIAREKVQAAKAKAEQPKYRDRASERRIMHNQPEIPLPETSSKGAGKKRHADGPPPPPSPPPPPVNPGEDQSNVGNRLLRMMGWTEGTGLGQDGEGRVEPMCVLDQLYPLHYILTRTTAKPQFTRKASGLVLAKVKRLASTPTDTLDTCSRHKRR